MNDSQDNWKQPGQIMMTSKDPVFADRREVFGVKFGHIFDEKDRKTKHYERQWPKQCQKCLTKYTPETWKTLQAVQKAGFPEGRKRCDAWTEEHRNCTCGSSLVIHLRIHDLKEYEATFGKLKPSSSTQSE